jgi:signal transduction histidine kinase
MTESQIPSGRHQRSMKNLLLDKRFQLKYTGYLVAIAFVLSVSLGFILLRTSAQVIEQSRKGARQGAQIVELGEGVLGESRKVSAVVRMNIVRDPVYKENPDLLDAFNADADQQDRKLDEQHAQLKDQRRSLERQAQKLEHFHKTFLLSLGGILALLVLGIGAAGIFVTHKIAGPIFKMKRHLREVAAGQLQVPWGLRKGDELVDFFDAFRDMVASLRTEREAHIARIEGALSKLEGGENSEAESSLRELGDDLRKSLQ